MLVDAAKHGDVEIPVFCYEPKLGEPVGACRMCLVEVEGIPKLQTACSTPVRDGMVVYTQTDRVQRGPERGRRVPARQPPARLPGLRQGRRVPAAGHLDGLGPGEQPRHRPQAPLPEAAAALAAGPDRPRALHPLLPLRPLQPGGRRGRAAAAARARRPHLRRHLRRPPLHRPLPRQHHRALPGRRADLARPTASAPGPGTSRTRARSARSARASATSSSPSATSTVERVLAPRQPRGRRRLALRQGPLRLPDDRLARADHRRRWSARGGDLARRDLGRGARRAPPRGSRGRGRTYRGDRRRRHLERGGLPAPADRPRGARLAPTSTRARAAAPARDALRRARRPELAAADRRHRRRRRGPRHRRRPAARDADPRPAPPQGGAPPRAPARWSPPSARPRSTAAPRRPSATPPARPPSSCAALAARARGDDTDCRGRPPRRRDRSATRRRHVDRLGRACRKRPRRRRAADGAARPRGMPSAYADRRRLRPDRGPRARQRPRPARGRLPPRRRPGLRRAHRAGRQRPEIRDALESGELAAAILADVNPVRDFPDPARLEAGAAEPPTSSSPSRCSTTSRPTTPTSSSPPSPTPRRRAPSPTPTAASSACAPNVPHPGERPPRLAGPGRALGRPRPRNRPRLASPRSSRRSPPRSPFYAGITHEEIGGRGVRWQDRAGVERVAGVPPPELHQTSPGPQPSTEATPHLAGDAARRGDSAPPTANGVNARHLPRPLGRRGHRAQPGAAVPGPQPDARARARRTPSGWASPTATRSTCARNGHSVEAQGRDPRADAPRRRLPDRGHRRRTTPTLLAGAQRSRSGRPRRRRMSLPLADVELRRGDLDPDRQVDRDLRRDLRDRAGADRGRAQDARPLPAPLRAEPRRPVRAPAAARRRGEAGRQGVLHARQRGAAALGAGPVPRRLLRDPARSRSCRSATSRTASASTGSTSRSASSTSSPSARSRSTACCSAAGPRARSTASSARCARRRS